MVADQGTVLDRIDYNVEMVVENVKGAQEELVAAAVSQKSSSKCRLILLIALLVIAAVVMLMMTIGNKSSKRLTSRDLDLLGDLSRRQTIPGLYR